MHIPVKPTSSINPYYSFQACSGAFALGTGLSWSSPTLTQIQDNCKPEDCYYDREDLLTAEQASWVGSLFTIGCLISSFATGFFMTKVGRKGTMMLMVVPSTLGWLLLLFAGVLKWSNPWTFYMGRIITGRCICFHFRFTFNFYL